MASKKSAKISKLASVSSKASKIKAPASRAVKTNLAKSVAKASVAVSVLTPANSWLQDATIEVPVPPSHTFKPGSRELEFSVGMRQQDIVEGLVRSELRGRALVHTEGQVLALVEASYVHVGSQLTMPEDLPQQLYMYLRPQLESLLVLGGHTPPLPATLDKIA